MSSAPQWTAEDEKLLQELTERKNERECFLTKQVGAIVEKLYFYNMGEQNLTRELIENADEVTEVLKPFLTAKKIKAAVVPMAELLDGHPKDHEIYVLNDWSEQTIRTEIAKDFSADIRLWGNVAQIDTDCLVVRLTEEDF